MHHHDQQQAACTGRLVLHHHHKAAGPQLRCSSSRASTINGGACKCRAGRPGRGAMRQAHGHTLMSSRKGAGLSRPTHWSSHESLRSEDNCIRSLSTTWSEVCSARVTSLQLFIIIIIINRHSGIISHTSHGHKTGTRSMQPVRSVPLGGPVVS